MPDIVTSKTFVDGEKGITATKLNQIISGAVIQPSFVTAKPSSSTLDPTDQMLEVKGAGTYATITGQQLIDSVSASVTQNITPTIWSVRLRSFQALSNNTFEVDQRNVGQLVSVLTNNMLVQDRWKYSYSGTLTAAVSVGQQLPAGGVLIPGTSFTISRAFHRITLTTAQATLAAGDFFMFFQNVEGPRWRELQNDVHSIQLLVRSSVAGLKFGLTLQDPTSAHSLSHLFTIASANTWTLVSFSNIPVWTGSGSFSSAPGSLGYFLYISLAGGSTYTAPANDTWQNGNFIAANGQSNFLSSAVNSSFDVAYLSHEPGAQASNPPMDCPFIQNLDDCLRYYQKTYSYATKAGSASILGGLRAMIVPSANLGSAYGPIAFYKPMAKVPTVTTYAYDGTANAALMVGGSNVTVSAVNNVGETGFNSIAFSANQAASAHCQLHYTADTGW